MTKGDLRLWRHRLGLKAHQHLLHTGARPDGLRAMATKRYAAWPSSCVAVSGIANPMQFEDHLSKNCKVGPAFFPTLTTMHLQLQTYPSGRLRCKRPLRQG